MREIIKYQILAKAILKDKMDINKIENAKLISAFLSGIAFVLEPKYSKNIINHIINLKNAKNLLDIIDSCDEILKKSGYIDLI